MKKDISHAKVNQKKTGVAKPMPDKIDFNSKTVIRDKVGHI